MSRLIDADRLIKYLLERFGPSQDSTVWFLYGLIAEQPSVEQDNWIPCSERLPEKCEMIIFQCKNGDMFVGKFKGLDSYNKEIWSTYGAKGRVMNGRKGMAWQPLPQPYKEVDSE